MRSVTSSSALQASSNLVGVHRRSRARGRAARQIHGPERSYRTPGIRAAKKFVVCAAPLESTVHRLGEGQGRRGSYTVVPFDGKRIRRRSRWVHQTERGVCEARGDLGNAKETKEAYEANEANESRGGGRASGVTKNYICRLSCITMQLLSCNIRCRIIGPVIQQAARLCRLLKIELLGKCNHGRAMHLPGLEKHAAVS